MNDMERYLKLKHDAQNAATDVQLKAQAVSDAKRAYQDAQEMCRAAHVNWQALRLQMVRRGELGSMEE